MRWTLRRAVSVVRSHHVARDAARLGYLASAALHALVSWAALALAWGDHDPSVRARGALRQLSGTVAGRVVLWLIAAGLCALALWQLSEAGVRRGGRDRARPLGRTLAYAALAWAAAGVADGPGDDDPTEEDVTAALMQHPLGWGAVAVLGLVVIAMAVHHGRKAWDAGFVRDLRAQPGPWVVRAGRAGYAAKAVALAVAGGLLVAAATGYRSEASQGLDAALGLMLGVPLGTALVTLIAIGFAGYAVYALARARHDWC